MNNRLREDYSTGGELAFRAVVWTLVGLLFATLAYSNLAGGAKTILNFDAAVMAAITGE
tara:strand:+ start:4694 stop:4870 length:177 start_codon:yes stop_codon:yes gene_type:complete